MFELSFSELLLVVVVALVVLKPEDLPQVMKTIARVIKKVRGFVSDQRNVLEDIKREVGLSDGAQAAKEVEYYITGMDGKQYRTYHPDATKPNKE